MVINRTGSGAGERSSPSRTLIVCADDFGLDEAVNEAVEAAFRDGFLTCASLMVGEGACADAVARARRLPGLGVGLHVAVTSGRPVLPAGRIPDLVGPDGRFDGNLARAGIRYFFLPRVRRQLADEIRAQFEAFRATGLPLDHVNVHQHYHLHPTVASLILAIGREYGLRAMRVPDEPVDVLRAVAPSETIRAPLYRFWIHMLRARLRRAGLVVNDSLLGLHWTGAMTPERVRALLENLPAGVSELYFHPSVRRTPVLESAAPGYQYVAEYEALMNEDNRACLARQSVTLATWSDLAGDPS
ncbi:hopanoid biosynthesis-associated protein HpnK [Phaeovibrio sulfidiphilus]|uniref:Hopanoid biosynthesis-associated protein HpnK n=1 Tax=Phaeovibrio sulfidiphilus TaxID=1220600 RepID=A0A8J6YPE3_9PROT|nr:hopanoid biosynthesis-associated protein HpnK [Phaeovibrio sulfidiphilus]MBE1237614.1 hopanoid biosynthesis-associated protein HpnK [Phaeovibrio sulfidiphilus]